MKKYLLIIALLFIASPVLAALNVPGGGTGSTTLTGLLLGNGSLPVRSVAIGSGLTLTGSVLSASGGGGSASTTLLGDSNTFSGNNTYSNTIKVSSLSGLVGANAGTLYNFASSSLFGYTPLNPTRTINTTWPLQGGGDLSGDRTLTFGGLSTSTAAVQGNIPYFSGPNTFANIATTSATINNGLTGSLTTLGVGQTIGLATINAGVLGAVTNGSVPTSQATSTLYGTGQGGQVLAWNNGVPQWVATTTLIAGAGISTAFNNGAWTISNTGSTFAYLFPAQLGGGNATSSLVGFSGGILATASSTIGNGTLGLTVSGPATTTGIFVSSRAYIGSSTAAGLATVPLTINPQLSSRGQYETLLYLNYTGAGGTVGDGGCINWGDNNIRDCVFANNGYQRTFTVGGTEKVRFRTDGSVGIGTTTAFAKLAVSANVGDNFNALFAVASTTGGTATTTLFSVDKMGFVAVNTPSNPNNLSTFSISSNDNINLDLIRSAGTAFRIKAQDNQDRIVFRSAGGSNDVPILFDSDDGGTTRFVVSGNGYRVGAGTTTPFAALSVQSNSSTVWPFAIATSTGVLVQWTNAKGEEYFHGDAPTISACGGGTPTVVGNNVAGRIHAGTGALLSCVINFADAGWTDTANPPACSASGEQGISSPLNASSTATQLTIAGGATLTSGFISYQCTGL